MKWEDREESQNVDDRRGRARSGWFKRGFEIGTIEACNTFE